MAIREKLILEGEDRASQAFDKAGGSLGKMEKTFQKAAVAGGVAILGTALVSAGSKAVQLASDAGEAASAFATTFGPATSRASAFVEDFANKAGFAEHELQQMLATAGNVAQGIGATEQESASLAEQMASLAGDVASFSNAAGGSESVLMALQSALTGEREALKTYGIAISEAEVQERALADTRKTSASELTRLEKANATVALAYEKAGKAVGDLDRTQDSAANSMRRIKALMTEAGVSIGEQLLPAVEQALPVIEEAIPAIAEAVGAIASLVASVGPAVTTVVGLVPDIVDGLKLITNSFTNVGAGALAAAAEILTFGQANTEGLQSTARGAAAANDLNNVLREIRKEAVPGADAATVYANAIADLGWKGSITEDALDRVADAVDVNSERQADALFALIEYGEANEWTSEQLQMLREAFGEVRGEAGLFSDDTREAERWIARFGGATGEAAEVVDEELSPALVELRDRMREAERASIEAAAAMAETVAEGARELVDGFEGAVEELDLTIAEFERNLEESIVQQANFYANLTLLAAAGFDDLAEELRERGPEAAGLVADLVDDMDRAADLEAMIDGAEDDIDRMADAYANAIVRNETTLLQHFEALGISMAQALEFGFSKVDLGSTLADLAFAAPGSAPPLAPAPGAPRTSSGAFAFQHGTGRDSVPGSPSQMIPAVLHGTELVVPPEGSGGRAEFARAIAEELGRVLSGSSRGTSVEIGSIIVEGRGSLEERVAQGAAAAAIEAIMS